MLSYFRLKGPLEGAKNIVSLKRKSDFKAPSLSELQKNTFRVGETLNYQDTAVRTGSKKGRKRPPPQTIRCWQTNPWTYYINLLCIQQQSKNGVQY